MKYILVLVAGILGSSVSAQDLNAISASLEANYQSQVNRCNCTFGGFILQDGTYTVSKSRRYSNSFKAVKPANAVAIWRTKTKGRKVALVSEFDTAVKLPVYVDGADIKLF